MKMGFTFREQLFRLYTMGYMRRTLIDGGTIIPMPDNSKTNYDLFLKNSNGESLVFAAEFDNMRPERCAS